MYRNIPIIILHFLLCWIKSFTKHINSFFSLIINVIIIYTVLIKTYVLKKDNLIGISNNFVKISVVNLIFFFFAQRKKAFYESQKISIHICLPITYMILTYTLKLLSFKSIYLLIRSRYYLNIILTMINANGYKQSDLLYRVHKYIMQS